MRIVAIMWHSHLNMLVKASKNVAESVELKAYSAKKLDDEPDILEAVLEEAAKADAILLYRSSEGFWETIEAKLQEIGKKIPVICIGYDPSYWMLSTVKPEVAAKTYSYIIIGGEENFTNMLKYIAHEVIGLDLLAAEPKHVPWEGLYHPDAPSIFGTIEEYLNWYHLHKSAIRNSQSKIPTVGILFSRHYWVNNNLEVEDALIRELEALGLNVIPAFSYSVKNEEQGCKGSGEVVCEYFLREDGTPRIDALIKLQNFFLGNTQGKDFDDKEVASSGVEILKRLDVPVFSPITSYYKTIDEWQNDSHGLGTSVGWSIAMPEFEGVIEPFIIGGLSDEKGGLQQRMPIEERCRKVVRRIANWVKLRQKPVAERKVAFILNNNPCASIEATVGGGAHLDTLESVARIMHRMKEAGYAVEPPTDGKELITTIMDRKAISEFRWTTVDEIVKKGGVLKQVTKEEYEEWFNTLSPRVRQRMCDAWGNPPGEEVNGVPPAMVYDGRILVTGVAYGNTVVCVQPKRGCAGARCDGQVCKILHDPDIPPPHQYMATYRYLDRDFGVDAIVHVGTHGNLEFLPGKGTALSGDCYPDIAIGDMPHLYIYNADNPPEGTIAKRRSYATLVDHMQTVMTQGGLYEELEELGRFLGEYEQLKDIDHGRAHALQHLIMDAIQKTNLDKEIKVNCELRIANCEFKKLSLAELGDSEVHSLPFGEIVQATHGILSKIRNTQIQDGMHIFGQLPEGEKRLDFINSILRYDTGEKVSLRKIVAGMMGMNLSDMLADSGKVCPHHHQAYGELLEEINTLCREFIRRMTIDEKDMDRLAKDILGERLKKVEYIDSLVVIKERLVDLNRRIDESQEIESLLHGFDGGYILPGPSGLITRGRDDILPTGRNFYSLDPHRIPTKAAWQIGQKLADAVIKKHKQEEGKIPENVAIYWQCTDIMWADGEGMAQIFYLLGVKPLWQPNGRVKGFDIIPLEELGRPRIDVTIRVSGITRDNFPNCMELVDEAIQAVASLPEPARMNFVRKHSLAQIAEAGESEENKDAWRNATLRVFASKPGTYQAGTQLAVYASAWKEEKDLSDVFVYWNGYAYGKGIFGEEKHKQLADNLKSVDITYNKVVSDEYDLFGCCGYFGTHGGMTAAARHLSGKEVRTYYGDTREPEHIEVRDMADEVRRVVRTKLLNPKWIEGMKQHGYKGAGDISKRIGRVYGWEATTQEVDDWIFDDITSTFVLNEENKKFFEENNPWALEEIGRRLLEAHQRGLWDADPDVLAGLKDAYLEIEGWIEEKMGDVEGDFQGGAVDILTAEDVADWGAKMQEIKAKAG
ncbi:MAG: cobaltochelatase subunit CobN [Bacteroidetes bacterium]|nr:cobaltochelatase subunit CobN [Bacteroidota bacterium]